MYTGHNGYILMGFTTNNIANPEMEFTPKIAFVIGKMMRIRVLHLRSPPRENSAFVDMDSTSILVYRMIVMGITGSLVVVVE